MGGISPSDPIGPAPPAARPFEGRIPPDGARSAELPPTRYGKLRRSPVFPWIAGGVFLFCFAFPPTVSSLDAEPVVLNWLFVTTLEPGDSRPSPDFRKGTPLSFLFLSVETADGDQTLIAVDSAPGFVDARTDPGKVLVAGETLACTIRSNDSYSEFQVLIGYGGAVFLRRRSRDPQTGDTGDWVILRTLQLPPNSKVITGTARGVR